MSATTTFPALPCAAACNDRIRAAVAAHYESLWRFLRRMGVPEGHAEDAVQQVLIVFARRAAAVVPAAERSFLFGTAARVASDYRRKAGRAPEVAGAEALGAVRHPGLDAEHQMCASELLACLDRILDALAPELRVVFVLAELEEATMAEIGQIVGIPPGTVASRLRRARGAFERLARETRTQMDQEGAP